MTARPLVDYGRMLDALGVEAELLLSAAHDAAATAPVPACPGLTLAETVRHVGSTYREARAWMAEGARPATWQREPGQGEALDHYFRSGLDEVMAEMATHPAEHECATWWPEDRTYGFWLRRMTHETVVHRVDTQGAASGGTRGVTPVAEDLAGDGIDEVLSLWLGHRLSLLGVTGTREAGVTVRAGDRRWEVTAGATGARVTRVAPHPPHPPRAPTGSDGEVSGAPMDVYLWLWGRWPPNMVHRSGDEDAIAQLWALLRLATR